MVKLGQMVLKGVNCIDNDKKIESLITSQLLTKYLKFNFYKNPVCS